ncbi:MAG TPA: sulfurtransferase TusA family protein, partial [Candidatus Limnocylindrales bacterium]|nr:sulfurtransferase TusA family protein [Candidatus Limnocylindrales bacterium]
MELIDCRGLSCPKPVLLTKSALETNPSGNLTVLVDSITARENVMRFVRNNGRVADWKEENGLFTITIASGQEKTGQANLADWRVSCATAQTNDAPVLLLSTDELGTGSSELGRLLLRNFIYTI